MKRLSLIGSWKRIGVQMGLLAGIGLAFVGGSEPPTADAAPKDCQKEGNCTFKKPLFGIILDNSSSMNEQFDVNTTRWEGAVEAITQAVSFDNGYIAENFILGLIRFGHDPDPNVKGTTIPADKSGLVDGQKLDVGWYDDKAMNKPYIECTNGDAIIAALEAAGAPSGGNKVGIGTWTKGAMDFAKAYLAQTVVDHPMDMGKRKAVFMVVTDGKWTNPQGNMTLAPANQDPAITAGDLFKNQDVPTYVVAIGDAEGQMFADNLAAAGGTMKAIGAKDPQALIDALKAVIVKIQQDVVAPVCTPGLPRIMVLMDASSSMLNYKMGTEHAPAGMNGWDQARDALAGDMSIFDIEIMNSPGNHVEDLVHLGLSVFGHNAPAEEKLVVQYGPCRKDNFAWALDPKTSCEAPGCVDPYAAPPIKWTFKDGSLIDPPNFDEKTLSHMPKCDFSAQQPKACIGSGTYTHLGLNLVQANIASYTIECKKMGAIYPCNDQTEFINILVTDGKYNSTDAQVQMPLQTMYTAGITTYVIGFGDFVDVNQLNKMADWGSGNMLDYYDANNQVDLEKALSDIIGTLSFDECCNFNDCAQIPEPTTEEPDPVVEMTTTSATDTDGTTTIVDPSTTGTTGDGTTTNPIDTDGTTTGVTTVPGTDTTDTAPTGSSSSASDSESTPTDPGPTNPSDPTNPSSDTEASGSGSSGTDTAGIDDEGCGCKVDDANNTRGLLGTLLTFGLAGFIRRRRRS
ncbi:vWA domain-containing protein [Nannocystis sp.]|uniref:vWA domain-containing protein n=1 Tax=Nannocystis sp. TaxID=1962667 RepID=UPI0025F2381F|nr:vWA domain-containing protein [Nannocystis sp.]